MKNNTLIIDGHKAVINFDPEIGMFRGEFCALPMSEPASKTRQKTEMPMSEPASKTRQPMQAPHGGADFYADSVEGLYKEGALSLKIYLDMCREKGLAPERRFSGRLNLRISPVRHQEARSAVSATGTKLKIRGARGARSA